MMVGLIVLIISQNRARLRAGRRHDQGRVRDNLILFAGMTIYDAQSRARC